MKILGMETIVGNRPKGLPMGVLCGFNEIFCELFTEFQAVKSFELRAWDYDYSATGVIRHGYFTLSKLRNWLAYHQFVTVERTKEPRKNDPTKKQSVWTVKPTKLGRQVFKKGGTIEVDCLFYDMDDSRKPTKLGIGKPYTGFTSLWKRVTEKAEAAGVSRTRREKWYSIFRRFWLSNLLEAKKDEAVQKVDRWAAEEIMAAPKRRHRFSIKNQPNLGTNHQLTVWCSK